MSDRKAPQRIHKLMVKEVKEKQANFGELRRFKKKAIVKKGLPNLPSLTIRSDAGITYVAMIQWGRELRLHYFDKKGNYLYCDLSGPETNIQQVIEEVTKQSKYISRYPPKVKVPTLAEREHAQDQIFKQIWKNFRRYFQIPKKYVKNRPLIRIVRDSKDMKFPGKRHNLYDLTSHTDEFIFIHESIPNKLFLYAYYAILFLLPKALRDDNEPLAEQLCQTLIEDSRLTTDPDPKWLINLKTLKNNLHVPIEIEIFPAFHLVAEYLTQGWQEKCIEGFVEWFRLDPNPLTPQNLPDLFELLYLEDPNNRHLLHLWCLLASKYEKSVPMHYLDPLRSPSTNPIDIFIYTLFSNRLVEAESLFTTLDLPPPMHKLVTETFTRHYSQVLGFQTAPVKGGYGYFINNSDCYISILDLMHDQLTLVEKDALKKAFPLKLAPFGKDPFEFSIPLQVSIRLEYVCYADQAETRELFRGTTTISM